MGFHQGKDVCWAAGPARVRVQVLGTRVPRCQGLGQDSAAGVELELAGRLLLVLCVWGEGWPGCARLSDPGARLSEDPHNLVRDARRSRSGEGSLWAAGCRG